MPIVNEIISSYRAMESEMTHRYLNLSPGGDPYGDYVSRAHAERAEALARVGFLAVAAVGHVAVAAVGLGRTLRRALSAYGRRRATYRALLRLDDRMLRDIGLTRDDIPLLVASGRTAVFEPQVAPVVGAIPGGPGIAANQGVLRAA
jgi:uncharacterized protein YjiS (DUF1127 family)